MLSVTGYWLVTYMNTIKVHVCRCANKCCVHGCRQDTDASIMEGEYEWVREYLYDVRQDEEKRTYALRETPDYMGYVDLNTRLMVHKRGKRMKSEQLQPQEFPRPSKVWTQPLLLPETCCLYSQRVGYCVSCVEIIHVCTNVPFASSSTIARVMIRMYVRFIPSTTYSGYQCDSLRLVSVEAQPLLVKLLI